MVLDIRRSTHDLLRGCILIAVPRNTVISAKAEIQSGMTNKGIKYNLYLFHGTHRIHGRVLKGPWFFRGQCIPWLKYFEVTL
jgi:hypothetical protein